MHGARGYRFWSCVKPATHCFFIKLEIRQGFRAPFKKITQRMQNCPHCHQKILLEDYKFCPYCAWRFDDNTPRAEFELGRLAALEKIKHDLRWWIRGKFAFIYLLIIALGYFAIFFGDDYIGRFVSQQVNEQIEKRLPTDINQAVKNRMEDISIKLYSLVDIFPIIEYDFYRIRNFDVYIGIVNHLGKETTHSDEREGVLSIIPKIAHIIEFITGSDDKKLFIEYSLGFMKHDQIVSIIGETIDALNSHVLLISGKMRSANISELKPEDRPSISIKGVNFIIHLNNLVFDKVYVPMKDLETKFTRNEPNIEEINFIARIDFKEKYKAFDELRKKYRETLSAQRGLSMSR